MKVSVVDYGMGNRKSVVNALRYLGAEVVLEADPDRLRRAGRVVLPGVGAFGAGMANLRAAGLDQALDEVVRQAGRPFLGICLGMQVLARTSDEEGSHEGFGWLEAVVRRLQPASPWKVPHMGWNGVRFTRASPLLDGIDDGAAFYFVHSYRLHCPEPLVLGAADHGGEFPALIQSGNILAAQFHPEKSQAAGMRLLENFLAWEPRA